MILTINEIEKGHQVVTIHGKEPFTVIDVDPIHDRFSAKDKKGQFWMNLSSYDVRKIIKSAKV